MINQLLSQKIKTIKKKDDDYPLLLKEILDAPEKIFFLGNLQSKQINDKFKIAIVGTRRATSDGRTLAKELAKKLAENGVIIVSGLAMGIDTAAHQGTIEANGKTIAVLANGLDSIYPAQNENLAKKILEFGGAIISEYPPGTPAYQNQFLERNRIVSGLCDATIIIEAPERSGSLVTARLAAEQGREVLVFPGPLRYPNYKGSHKLIRDGARLVTSIEDIIEDLGLNSNKDKQKEKNGGATKLPLNNFATGEEKLILKIIKNSNQPLGIDRIIKLTKLEPQKVNQIITFSIIKGMIKETEKGYTF
ncbi:MAG: DNA-processing protein DprA [Patescibacteria group bacterium]